MTHYIRTPHIRLLWITDLVNDEFPPLKSFLSSALNLKIVRHSTLADARRLDLDRGIRNYDA